MLQPTKSALRDAYEAARATVAALAPLIADTGQPSQTTTAETLAALTREDAPAALWRLGAYAGEGLEGQIVGDQDGTSRRRALAAWQRVLGAGPVEARRIGDAEHLYVRGSYQGVAVTVVTVVDADQPAVAVAS